jgi:hypothetical protein
LSLTEGELLFRVRRVIKLSLRDRPVVYRDLAQPLLCVAVLQGKVMSDPKDPSAKTLSRSPELKMPEKGQKCFLNDFFGVMHRDTERMCVAKQRIAKLVKELHDIALDLRGFG